MADSSRARPTKDYDIENIGDNKVAWSGTNEAEIYIGPEPMCLVGRGRLRLIQGNVTIHGYSIRNDTWYSFESPRWTSWLTIVSEHNIGEFAKVQVVSTRRAAGDLVPSFEVKSATETTSRPTVVPIQWSDAMESITSEYQKLREYTQQTGDSIAASADGKGLTTAVVGAKNVGKSTCVRYSINRLLSHSERVCVLDGDLGQPEFSPPGMLTLTIIRRPIFSQPHLHIVTNSKSASSIAPSHEAAYFFGATTSQTDPDRYVKCLSNLADSYRGMLESEPDLPLVINLDGWVKGLGLQVLDAILTTLRPDHVVQILGNLSSKLFDLTLPVECRLHVCHAYNVDTSSLSTVDAEKTMNTPGSSASVELPGVQSLADVKNLSTVSSSIPASVLRTLRLVSYFLDDISLWDRIKFGMKEFIADGNCILSKRFAAQQPYKVPFDLVKWAFTNEESTRDIKTTERILDALDCSIVGLCCSKLSDDTLLPCVGLGLIRAIDRSKRLFYILTPVDSCTLMDVDTILKGQIPVPLECSFRGVAASAFLYHDTSGADSGLPGAEPMRSRNNIYRRSAGA